MPHRSRKEHGPYARHTNRVRSQPGLCEFCKVTPENKDFVEETKSFWVIKNIFPYSYWDFRTAVDHLLILPKKHTDTVADFTAEEAVEYVGLIASYESRGYNTYSRAPQSSIKSVAHQHTHLIKTEGKMINFLFYSKRPYIRLHS